MTEVWWSSLLRNLPTLTSLGSSGNFRFATKSLQEGSWRGPLTKGTTYFPHHIQYLMPAMVNLQNNGEKYSFPSYSWCFYIEQMTLLGAAICWALSLDNLISMSCVSWLAHEKLNARRNLVGKAILTQDNFQNWMPQLQQSLQNDTAVGLEGLGLTLVWADGLGLG